MIYRIYDFIHNRVCIECDCISDMLHWLNENYIKINNCYIQYFDGEWINF